jgi:hypothetical protein
MRRIYMNNKLYDSSLCQTGSEIPVMKIVTIQQMSESCLNSSIRVSDLAERIRYKLFGVSVSDECRLDKQESVGDTLESLGKTLSEIEDLLEKINMRIA